jgi:predicted GNAT family acetyltransferase
MAYIHTTHATADVAFSFETPFSAALPNVSRTFVLTEADREAALHFLNERPVHTVAMTSMILDNGFESPLNRGTFYGYHDRFGTLEGIALIGHATLVEARSDAALLALSLAAKKRANEIHMILSSGDASLDMWALVFDRSGAPRRVNRETLFEAGFPFPVAPCPFQVRAARPEELEQVAEAHAAVTFIESGVDPMARDREGFLKRVARRIEQGRTFVVFEDDRLMFKADVISLTGESAYLEGVYVAEEHRGKGIGPKCLAEVTRRLLGVVDNVCLLSSDEIPGAHRAYEKAGFSRAGHCTAVFA